MTRLVLVVDDNPSVRMLVREYLEAHDYQVITASNGREALMLAQTQAPDLVLLDIMMPEIDGYEVVRRLRRQRTTPIILLTARLEESDKVHGLDLGADDYITKPFGMAELLARVRAVLRRGRGESVHEQSVIRAADIVVDRDTRSVRVGPRHVDLTPSEFELLTILASAPGRVRSRSELLLQLQGEDSERIERTIDVHIRNLRSKIERDPAHPRYIQTVFGVGYRFGPVEPEAPS
ncbi:MAG: response regulator transcription factor [Chloroflexi bacterium]|nr:response regulator transcription factor [Chloroflexota bacterium]